MSDIYVTIDPNGGFSGTARMTVDAFARLPQALQTSLLIQGDELARHLLFEMRRLYLKVERTVEGGFRAEFKQKLEEALTYDVRQLSRYLAGDIFKLRVMDLATRNQGKGTENRGWFLWLEDGHGDEYKHGSEQWGFCSLSYAEHLCEECIQELGLYPPESDRFREHVKENFRGRYGNGIMVKLSKPIFPMYPEFGGAHGEDYVPAKRFIQPHPGYKAWDVIEKVGEMGQTLLPEYMDKVVDDAFRRITE